MNPFQQRSIQLADDPTRRAVRVPFNQGAPVLPTSFDLIGQSDSNLPSRQ
jgi:hypothetical protein